MNKVLDGLLVSNEIKKSLEKKIKKVKKELTLVVYQVGNNPASEVYVGKKKALCEEMGIKFILKKYDHIIERKLITEIKKDNLDNNVTSILVQLPLPKELNEKNILEAIDYKKDVDGLTSINTGKLSKKEESIIPCTALGVMKILEFYNIDISSKNVVVIGRSSLVGIPTSMLCLQKDATVTICHSKTKDLNKITKKADILVVAIGKPNYITRNMIKKDSIIIDVGINRYNNKLTGDVNFKDVYKKCSMITPVPKGIGPMTVIMLINNIIECFNLQK